MQGSGTQGGNTQGNSSVLVREDLPATRILGRQPVLDKNQLIYGYELSFGTETMEPLPGEEEVAARSIIDICLLAPEQDQDVLFLHCTRKALLSRMVTLLPPQNIVLELQDSVDPDEEVIACCKELREKGYRFAVELTGGSAGKLPFIEVVEFINVDFAISDAQERTSIYAMARGSRCKFVAQNILNTADFHTAMAEGCTFFQGYFFCSPVTVATSVIPQNQIIYLRLLAALTQVPANLNEIERLVMSDISICYRLLRLVNSALYARPSPISSIRGAVILIGDDEFRKMVTVAMATVAPSPQSKAAIRVALERARFCELLAPVLRESASALYLLGMLSLMDVILNMPMRQVIELLPLHPKIKSALVGERSSLKAAMDLCHAREKGGWIETTSIQESIGLAGCVASRLYSEAIQWAEKVTKISALA